MAETTRATAAVVDFITTATWQNFPADAIALGKRCIIDGLGVILAGSTTRGSGIVREFIRESVGTRDAGSTVLGAETFQTTASAAALANGASGTQFLEAFLTGFEVECKIAEAIHPNHYKNGFHSSGTIGTFGAMTAAARLLGLNADATANAISIAASTFPASAPISGR